MVMNDTLKTARQILATPDIARSSEELLRLQEGLNIPGAQAAIDRLEERRRGMLLTANDGEIEAVEVEIRGAVRDLDRRRAAWSALDEPIAAAREREAKAEIEGLGKSARAARVRALQAYVALDRAALELVDLLADVRREEAIIADANRRLREDKRSDLLVALPMDELALLAGVDGEFLPRLSWWRLHGYTNHSAEHPGDAEWRPILAARRFGRLAELLPGGPPTVPKPQGPPATPRVVDRAFVPQV